MEDKEFSSINVIPFVDILLVLLTIVLITATFVVQGVIPVNLPRAMESKEESLKTIAIVITREGDVFFENREVNLDELDALLKSLDHSVKISLFADKDTKVQYLINVLDLLKKHGLEKVLIRTEKG